MGGTGGPPSSEATSRSAFHVCANAARTDAAADGAVAASLTAPRHLGLHTALSTGVIYQTHQIDVSRILHSATGLARAVASWRDLNPEYEHVYADDAAMRAYVAAEGCTRWMRGAPAAM